MIDLRKILLKRKGYRAVIKLVLYIKILNQFRSIKKDLQTRTEENGENKNERMRGE